MRLSRALFVLPTLFTLSSVLMGVISLVAAAEGNFHLSAVTIFFAILFDSIDGGVARLTRTQSKFGIQIDSLADVISFGVAPAVLVYLALLRDRLMLGFLDVGLAAAFLYLAAGAIRLARYNVDADRKPGPIRWFTGLPIPAGAGCLAGLVLGLTNEGRMVTAGIAILFLLLMGFLMVSTVRYRKKVSLRNRETQVLLALLAVTVLATGVIRPAFGIFSFFAFYVAVGLVEGTLKRFFATVRRRRDRRLDLRNRDRR